MTTSFLEHLSLEIQKIRDAGLYKTEREITSKQSAQIAVNHGKPVVNMCANNYLGLADSEELIHAAQHTLDEHGFGVSSVRFICGTQAIHKQLEEAISRFLGTEDTILYSSCFDANGGLFETLLSAEDAIVSDELNHASIIDGIRLCKAQRLRYTNNSMANLEQQLQETATARFRMIATDGVFSMDGTIANLAEICNLAEKYKALVMVDDSHAVGFLGPKGRGTHEYHNCINRVDIITGTLGKALGGASGGYTSGRREIIQLLRQRSRPYLFSNSLAPPIVTGTLAALSMLDKSTELRDRLFRNTTYFRQAIQNLGFNIAPGEHPIVPIMLGDARLAATLADALLRKGVYVIGFSFPVVPHGKARIRTQVSAAHSQTDLEFVVQQFAEVKREFGI